ncbi:unnamed protein product [Urochloa humidicola]
MSRQARKEAAAATQDLLRLDAARRRKAPAAAAPMRKGAAAAKLKGAAAAMRKGAAAAMRKGASAPMLNGSGWAATQPPRSYTEGNNFFNGNSGDFSNAGDQHWDFQSSDPATWGNNATPPGGFTNYIQPNLSQEFEIFGEPSQPEDFSTPISARDNTYVPVDSDDEAPRTEKRIFWTQEEDVRMMSSWLLNSTDSSVGADRKNDSYWTDVEATYNETTPSQRKRNAKQIKDRFHKVNKWTDLFHSAWLKARMIYTSGYNDQMWIEKAHVFYIKDNEKQNLGPFVLLEVWNTVKTEAKWITYNNGLKAARKRAATKGLGTDKDEEDSSHVNVDDLEEQPRPMGQKAAKKLKYAKSKEVEHIDLEELDKFAKIQDEHNANRLKVLEVQQKLSSEKIEQAKMQMEVAKVQREARKLEVEARVYETYNRLLSVDTSLMSDEEKVDHGNTLKFLQKKLFADN